MTDWHPISSAPKETPILIANAETGDVCVSEYEIEVYYEEHVQHESKRANGDLYRVVEEIRHERRVWQYGTVYDPTHWMPLPKPPESPRE